MSDRNAEFHCTVCGECCRGNQMVWLTPVDLDRLVVYLGIPNADELESRRIIVIDAGEHGVSRPRLRFPPGPAGTACRFLINDLDEGGRLWGRCSLHGTAAKPLVCRLAPLSRSFDLESGDEDWREVPPVVGCPGWGNHPPPSRGRRIPTPAFDSGLRADLDGEAEYFRELERFRR